MKCEICQADVIFKAIPGSKHYPRRPECPIHGYIFREKWRGLSVSHSLDYDPPNTAEEIAGLGRLNMSGDREIVDESIF